nr:hypothetical protein [Oryzihumus leptocrescens]
MVTKTCALVCTDTSPPAAVDRRQASTRASPRRWSLLLRSLTPSTGFGADNGPIAASNTLAPSGSRRSWYSTIPSSARPADNDTPCLSRSCRTWNS